MVLTKLRTTYLAEWRMYFPWKSFLLLRMSLILKFSFCSFQIAPHGFLRDQSDIA